MRSQKMKNIVVTGGARGFGREIAEKAHQLGYRVMTSVRTFDESATALQNLGITCEILEMKDPASIDAFAKKVMVWCGGDLYALINNAGTAYPAPIELVTRQDLVDQFQTNVFGHIQLTQQLLEALRQNRGRVVMMSSQTAVISAPMVGAYSASKRALEALSEALIMEVGHEIDVCLVRPGPYATAIWERSVKTAEHYDFGHSAYNSLARTIQNLAMSRRMPPASQLADLVVKILKLQKPRFIYAAPLLTRVTCAMRKFIPNRWYFAVVSFVVRRKMAEF